MQLADRVVQEAHRLEVGAQLGAGTRIGLDGRLGELGPEFGYQLLEVECRLAAARNSFVRTNFRAVSHYGSPRAGGRRRRPGGGYARTDRWGDTRVNHAFLAEPCRFGSSIAGADFFHRCKRRTVVRIQPQHLFIGSARCIDVRFALRSLCRGQVGVHSLGLLTQRFGEPRPSEEKLHIVLLRLELPLHDEQRLGVLSAELEFLECRRQNARWGRSHELEERILRFLG